jgi:hypothetical protein
MRNDRIRQIWVSIKDCCFHPTTSSLSSIVVIHLIRGFIMLSKILIFILYSYLINAHIKLHQTNDDSISSHSTTVLLASIIEIRSLTTFRFPPTSVQVSKKLCRLSLPKLLLASTVVCAYRYFLVEISISKAVNSILFLSP